jgi:class 3 adenylate cyclase
MEEIFRNSDLLLLKSLAFSTAAAFENSSLYAESMRIAEKERFVRNIFQKYVPKEVANEILNLGDRDLIKLGEKKLLTLLNVDIRGYSKMSKKVRAEDMVEVLNYFFMVMGTAVLKYKGILDKYLGDGLLAIFGAPVTSPNPALDATLAAMEMVENLETVNEYAANRYGIPLKIGISINTGEAIVGNIGFEKKMDYTVIGDVVNDTFRLQELTREKSNSIFISETTYLQVKSIVQTRSLGVRALESNENEMVVYEVIDERKASDLRTAEPQ